MWPMPPTPSRSRRADIMSQAVKRKIKVALCPECGHDKFEVTESEKKRVRLVATNKPPYFKEEMVSFYGNGYQEVICLGCGEDLEPNDWANPKMFGAPPGD